MMVMILIMKIIFLVPDINSLLKINKKLCSQVYLEEYNFINDSYDKNG